MKWKASFRKLTALLLSVVLMLSLCTTAFATASDGGDSEEKTCTQPESCNGDHHVEGCALYEAPDDTPGPTPPTCDQTVNCAVEKHEDDCPAPAVKEVQDLIDQLPDANAITQSDAGSLNEIGAKIEELSPEQKNALKLDKYNAAKEAIDNLLSQGKTPAESTPAESTPVEPTPAETLQQMISNLATALSTLDPSKNIDIETAHNKVAEIYSYATENGLEINEDQEVAILTQLSNFYPTDTDGDISTSVAKIGETEYETVNAAIQAIVDGTATGTIDVILSTNEDVQIPANANITLNLAENITLSNANSDTITNNGILTVTGAGTITNTTIGKSPLLNTGTASLNGCTFTRGDDTSDSGYYTVVNRGSMSINGATITHTGTHASCVQNGWNESADVSGTATMTVNSGMISGGLNAVKNDAGGVLEVKGGTITNSTQYAIMNWHQATVSGGTITCTATQTNDKVYPAAIYNSSYMGEATSAGKLNINGGVISTTESSTYALDNRSEATISGSATLTGASSAVQSKGTDAKTTISGGTLIGKKYYAITAKDGSKVEISSGNLSSSGSASAYVVRADAKTEITITGGTFKNTDEGTTGNATVYVGISSKVDIRGGDFSGSAKYAVNNNGGTLNITDGNFTSANSAVYVKNDAKAIATISGGSFTSTNNNPAVLVAGTKGSLTVSGGTYSSDVSNYVSDGNKAILDENGTYFIGADTSTAIAEFNGYGYTSVQAAIDAAAAAGSGEVTLLNSTSENIVIPADTNITLNLEDGVTLTNDPTSTTAHTITNKGTLTITGSGTIDNVSHARAALYNDGICTIENGTLTRSAEAGSDPKTSGGNSWYVIRNSATGDLTINGGSVKSTGNFSSLIDNYNKLTITDGTFTNGMIVIKNEETGTLNISGGSFEATYYSASNDAVSAVQNWGNASISGGNFTSKGVGVYASEWDRDSTLAITGGTFTGGLAGIFVVSDSSSGDSCNGNNVTVTIANAAVSGNPHAVYVYDAETAETTQQLSVTIQSGTFTGDLYTNAKNSNDDDTKISVSGGSFSSEVAKEYCADGFYPNKNADGTYSVHVHNYGEPVFAWTDANTCTVTTTCGTCDDTLTETCTVTKETIAATATEAEKTVYTATATINGKTVTDTKTINGLAILKGKDQSYALYSGDTITILCSGALGDFVSVSVDGKAVASSNYTVKSGSTVLTFSNAYLNTLSVGDHTVTMNYKAGVYTANSVSTTLTVTAGWEKLAIEVKANRTSVRPGKTITYTLTVTNNTGTDLTDIVVSNTVDKNLTFSSSSGSGTYTAKDGLWTISELKAGKTAKITVKYTVKSGVKDGTSLVYTSAITGAEAANGETLSDNVSPSGSVTVKVSNKASIIPATGDTSNIGLWIGVLAVVLVALVAVGVTTILKTRKKK